MFRRMRNKFLILNLSIISVVMFIAFTVVYVTTAVRVQESNRIRLERAASNATPQVVNQEPLLEPGDQPSATGEFSLYFSLLLDENGDYLAELSHFDLSQDKDIVPEAVRAVANVKSAYSTVKYARFCGRMWIYKTIPVRSPTTILPYGVIRRVDYTYAVFLDISETQSFLGHLLFTFVVFGSLMLFVILGISLFFANRAVAPVEQSFVRQQQFVADASHELKTPIAVISANADALLANKAETVESQEKWVNYILAETDRMNKLVSDLLDLAKTDSEKGKKENLPFNLSNEALDAVLSMEAVAFEKGITIKQDIPSDIYARGNSEKVRQVISILLDNAIKYSNENGRIAVRLSEMRNHVTFAVANTGAGIPKELLPKIFDRFYRADPSREHVGGGYGLGLAIAKTTVERMGGKITAQSVPGKITTFTVQLNKRQT